MTYKDIVENYTPELQVLDLLDQLTAATDSPTAFVELLEQTTTSKTEPEHTR
jgi:hypothetical protein